MGGGTQGDIFAPAPHYHKTPRLIQKQNQCGHAWSLPSKWGRMADVRAEPHEATWGSPSVLSLYYSRSNLCPELCRLPLLLLLQLDLFLFLHVDGGLLLGRLHVQGFEAKGDAQPGARGKGLIGKLQVDRTTRRFSQTPWTSADMRLLVGLFDRHRDLSSRLLHFELRLVCHLATVSGQSLMRRSNVRSYSPPTFDHRSARSDTRQWQQCFCRQTLAWLAGLSPHQLGGSPPHQPSHANASPQGPLQTRHMLGSAWP